MLFLLAAITKSREAAHGARTREPTSELPNYVKPGTCTLNESLPFARFTSVLQPRHLGRYLGKRHIKKDSIYGSHSRHSSEAQSPGLGRDFGGGLGARPALLCELLSWECGEHVGSGVQSRSQTPNLE